MHMCNISVQRGQSSVALNYDVVARCASTNHDTAALTEKRRQNTSYRQLAGMNLGFTRSWQFHLIGSTFVVKFEREYEAFIPPGYAPSSSDWSPWGRGGSLRPAGQLQPTETFNMARIRIVVTQDRTQHRIKTKTPWQTLSKSRQVSLAPSHSFLCILWQGKNLR